MAQHIQHSYVLHFLDLGLTSIPMDVNSVEPGQASGVICLLHMQYENEIYVKFTKVK